MKPALAGACVWYLAASVPSYAVAKDEAEVRVDVTDVFGQPLPMAKIKVSGTDLTTDIEYGRIFKLPYGRYTVNVIVPGFAPMAVSTIIDQPSQIISVGMRLGALEAKPPACAIRGHITSADKAVRVRAVQLFGSYSTDVPLTDAGRFEIPNLECGHYLLMAVGSSKLVGTMTATASVKPTLVEMTIGGAPQK